MNVNNSNDVDASPSLSQMESYASIPPMILATTHAYSRRWSRRLISLLTTSRAASTLAVIFVIALMDHASAAADHHVTTNLRGAYDPLVLACFESLFLLCACLVPLYIVFARWGLLQHLEWTSRAKGRDLAGTAFILGAHVVLSSFSAKGVSTRWYELSAVIAVPLVFVVRYMLQREPFHFFNLSGGAFVCIGAIGVGLSTTPQGGTTAYDYYAIAAAVCWGLFLIAVAELFHRTKQLPVLGVLVALMVGPVLATMVTVAVVEGVGLIHDMTWGCLLFGLDGCGPTIPFTLLGHALTTLIRLICFVAVTKYVGAPVCVMTSTASSALRFYTHSSLAQVDVASAVVSAMGCAVFLHGQWLMEVECREAWEEALRESMSPTILRYDDATEVTRDEYDDDERDGASDTTVEEDADPPPQRRDERERDGGEDAEEVDDEDAPLLLRDN